MKVYSKTIPYEKDGEKFTLIGFGDVHYGSANCDKSLFIHTLRRHGKARNTYLIDMGDACDAIVPKDAKRYRPKGLDPELEFEEDVIDRQIEWYCEQHEKLVNPEKFLGIVSGNHHDIILEKHGTDPTKRIAYRLKTQNLGYCFFYRLLFKREGKGYQELVIYGHHGWGGGSRTEGGNITRFCKAANQIEGADICLYGHTHDKWAKPMVRVKPVGYKVKEVPKMVANTGTFLKTLSDSETPSYSERAGYPPRALGYVSIEITTPTEDRPYFDLRETV